jgi:prolyl 4-hydroxylase
MRFVSYYDDVIPKDLCRTMIEKFETNVDQQEDTILEGHRCFKEINITKYEEWKPMQDKLFGALQFVLGIYAKQWKIDEKILPEELGYEQFRMKRYLPNDRDEFRFHVDVQSYATARRFLVAFWYLNDVEEGGETAFQAHSSEPITLKVQPKQSRMLLFPPLWTHPHMGMKPISGPKYIVGTYLHYV